MSFFTIIFGILISILVITKSLLWFIITSCILLIISIIIAIKNKNIFFISIYTIAVGMSLLAFISNIYFIFQKTQGYKGTFITNQKLIIQDKLQKNKYIVKDSFTNTFILQNCKYKYDIGNILLINGYKNPAQLSGDSFQDYMKEYFIKNKLSNLLIEIKKIGKFDYNIRLLMKGYSGIIYAKSEKKVGESKVSAPLKTKRNLGNKIQKAFANYDKKYEGFLMGLLIGDKSSLDENIYQQFISSGIVHIIAVSGGNIIMIIIFLNFLLFFLPFKIRTAIILAIIIFYSFVCGLDSSVVRATIMGGLGLFALLFGHITNTWRLLQIAFVIMLVLNPFSIIYDLGFILSFMALAGILFSSKLTININKNSNKFKQIGIFIINNYLIPTIGATVLTLPCILVYIGKINLMGIIANILVLPFIPFLMIYGLIVSLMSNLSILENSLIINVAIHIEILVMNWIFFISKIFGEVLVLKIGF